MLVYQEGYHIRNGDITSLCSTHVVALWLFLLQLQFFSIKHGGICCRLQNTPFWGQGHHSIGILSNQALMSDYHSKTFQNNILILIWVWVCFGMFWNDSGMFLNVWHLPLAMACMPTSWRLAVFGSFNLTLTWVVVLAWVSVQVCSAPILGKW